MNKIIGILKPVVEEVGNLAETAKTQVAPSDEAEKLKDETKQLVKDIYKPGEEKSAAEIAQNKAKDEAKLEKTRAKLAAHQEYFQNLINRPKAPEEKKADELEREKKQEMIDLQQKEKKKPPPLAVQNAQNIEKHRGSSG